MTLATSPNTGDGAIRDKSRLPINSKNEVESIPAHVLRQIAKEIENG